MKLFALKEIKKLASLRKSEILVYFTSDKRPIQHFATQIADDVIPFFYEELIHLLGSKKTRKISLFLYSRGGFLTTPWPLVNLIREYCKEFEVIIPSKALSAATLIALGADKIVMTPLSQLSPVDPMGNFPVGEKKTQQIAVEDIISFFNFTKDKAGINSQAGLTEALKELTKHITPPIVGSINRTHSLIRMVAEQMLDLHNKPLPKKRAKSVIKLLTETLFSHQHYINRREVKNYIGLGNIVEYADEKNEKAINALYKVYAKGFQLEEEFNPILMLGDKDNISFKLMRAAIHSENIQHSLISEHQIKKVISKTGEKKIGFTLKSNQWVSCKNKKT